MASKYPPREDIGHDQPLRLAVAAALAFPDGSMTASGLRREAARGRLAIERIAGKDYTTLANIERMRELCRVEAKVHTCGYVERSTIEPAGSPMPLCGSSRTADTAKAQDAAQMIVDELKRHSPATSGANISRPRKRASVRPLTSLSPTS
jgi:hypothetical protein